MKALTEKRTICLKNAGDRMLDADEILHAFDALEATAKAAATGSVPFSRYLRNNTTLKTLCVELAPLSNHSLACMHSFPAHVQDQLKELDDTGDEQLDAKEILAGIQALAREKKKSKRLMWLSAGLLAFSLLLLVAMGGLMFEIIQMTKESKMDPSGVMRTKNSDAPVQTASMDTVVDANGVMAVRPTPGSRRIGCGIDNATCPASPIKTAQNTEN